MVCNKMMCQTLLLHLYEDESGKRVCSGNSLLTCIRNRVKKTKTKTKMPRTDNVTRHEVDDSAKRNEHLILFGD